MGPIRRRQIRDSVGIGRIRFTKGDSFGPIGLADVSLQGPPEALVHLPAAYLDEVLLRDRKADAWAFHALVSAFLLEIAEGKSTYGVRFGKITYFLTDDVDEDFGDEVLCDVTTALQPTLASFTRFSPRRTATAVLRPTFFLYWDAVMDLADELGAGEGIAFNLTKNLYYQLAYYKERGLPKKLGDAPRFAGFRGASDRMADEIGAVAGLTGDELRALPEDVRDRMIAEHTRRSIDALKLTSAGEQPPGVD